jgi:hypothetical protein
MNSTTIVNNISAKNLWNYLGLKDENTDGLLLSFFDIQLAALNFGTKHQTFIDTAKKCDDEINIIMLVFDSTIKQVNSVGAWALCASHSLTLSITTLCTVFDQPSRLSLSNTMRASSADPHSSP